MITLFRNILIVSLAIIAFSFFLTPDKAGASSEAMSQNVSISTGAATYKVDIEVPPGRLGLAPNLSIIYNSFRKNGWLGVGWNLDMGAIQRSTKFGVDYNADDYVLTINGSSADLVPRNDWGSNYYGAKIEGGFSKIYKNPSGGFIQTTREGMTYYFGTNLQSRQVGQVNGQDEVFKWCLEKVEDSNGNYMVISYYPQNQNQGELYIYTIAYTGNGSLNPSKYVQFHLEERPDYDTPPMYTTNFKVVTAKRLKTIEIRAKADVAVYGDGTLNIVTTGVLQSAYDLQYDHLSTSRSVLTAIKRYGRNATINQNGVITGGSSLPAMSMDYYESANNFDTPAEWLSNDDVSGYLVYNVCKHVGDFNGDGRNDYMWYYNGWHVALSTGSGFDVSTGIWLSESDFPSGLTYNLGFEYIGDFNGDGRSDYMWYYNGWNVALANENGDGFENPQQWLTNSDAPSGRSYTSGFQFVRDFNGDGKSDYMWYYNGWYVALANENGDGFESPTLWLSNADVPGELSYSSYYQHVGDFNGDGMQDYMWYYNGWHVGLSTGSDFDVSTGKWLVNGDVPGYLSYNSCQHIGDFNGDGKTDYMWYYNGWHVALSNGIDGFDVSTGLWLTNADVPGKLSYNYGFQHIGDFNGDGKSDYMWYYYGWNVALSNGKGFDVEQTPWLPDSEAPPNSLTWSSTYQFVTDFTGDGKSDYLWYYNGWYLAQDPSPTPDLLDTVENGSGGSISFDYIPSTEWPRSTQYPDRYLPFKLQTVFKITANDGFTDNNNDITYDLSYKYGWFDFDTRDFRGFEYSTGIRSDGTKVLSRFYQDEFRKGRQKWVILRNPSNKNLTYTTTAWNYIQSWGDSKFVRLTKKTSRHYESGAWKATTVEDFVYNNTTGFITKKTVSGPDAENIITDYVYAEQGSGGDGVWRLIHETITGSVSGKVREVYNDYDSGTGNLLSEEYWNDGGTNPVIEYTYDPYGNRLKTYDAKGNPPTTTIYDSVTKTMPVKTTYPTTNGVTHIVRQGWNRSLQKVTWEKDENGNYTYYTYDTFKRLKKVRTYEGNSSGVLVSQVDTVYSTAFPRKITTKVKEDSQGNTINKIEYFDGLGRVIKTESNGENGAVIIAEAFYDDMGREYRTEGPRFSTQGSDFPWAETTYDYHGRVATVTSPDGQQPNNSVISYAYDGLTMTVTDPDNKKKTEKKDYLGRLIEVIEDPGGENLITEYTYNGAGDLLTVTDSAQNVTTIQYDSLGNKKYMDDPDMGEWSYTYDLNGNLKTQTDNKGQVITFEYDELNRIESKTYSTSDSDVFYTYDTATDNGKGALHTVSKGSVITTYNEYDALGQVKKVTKTIDGVDYITSYVYDLAGKPTVTTYPDNFKVTNSYYPGTGLLEKVTGSDNIDYAVLSNYEPTGKMGVVDHDNNNGSSTIYSYDPQSTRLTDIVTYNKNGVPIQNRSYTYTQAGNIDQIFDYANSITYSYTYDALHRLKTETNTGSHPSITYNHDNLGNITSKKVGSKNYIYTYTGTTGGPHAVNKITVNSTQYNFSYDANGNLTSGRDLSNLFNYGAQSNTVGTRTITYNADNMPVKIVHSVNGTTNIVYDGDGTRVKKTKGSSKTIYVGGHYEVINGAKTRYIFAGNLRVAMKKSSDRFYFHKDHLGSSTVMTKANGSDQETTEYTPYGSIRIQSGTEISNYNFTDQELDPETGLYNYNARLYDPSIGLFISADTIVPDFSDPQTLNRYMYARGNPLIYVDPSGHDWGLSMLIGAIVGAVSSGAQSDWNLEAMLVGSVIGGISGGVYAEVSELTAGTLWALDAPVNAAVAETISMAAGGAAAGATAGGLNAAYYGGDIGEGMLKGAGYGALTGGAFGAIGAHYGATWDIGRVAVYSLTGGGIAELTGNEFQEGAFWALVASTARFSYNKLTKYDTVWEGGDRAISKEPHTLPAEGRINWGTQHRELNPNGWFNEGGRLSRIANRFPGMNAVGGPHDVFQVRLDQFGGSFARNLFNVPGMLPAAAMTYGGLMTTPIAATTYISVSHKYHER